MRAIHQKSGATYLLSAPQGTPAAPEAFKFCGRAKLTSSLFGVFRRFFWREQKIAKMEIVALGAFENDNLRP